MGHSIQGTYNITFVAASCFITIIACYAALDLAGRVRAVQGKVRRRWLLGGALAMGVGIWSMQHVGMLTHKLPVPMSYHIPLTVVSMLAAISSSYLAMFTLSRHSLRATQLCASAVVMGSGIVIMHDTGMAAMHMAPSIAYDPFHWCLSAAIAVVASLIGLGLSYYYCDKTSYSGMASKLAASIVLGGAIIGMHYTSMAAPRFSLRDEVDEPALIAHPTGLLTIIIVVFTLAFIVLALYSTYMDRKIYDYYKRQARSEEQYKSLFQNNSEGVVSINPLGRVIGCNPAASIISGYPEPFICSMSVQEMYGISDSTVMTAHFLNALEGGHVSMEAPFLHRDGRRLLFSLRLIPIVVDSQVAGVYALFQDITELKMTEARMHEIAYRDELTGLPNRRAFMKQLKELSEQDGELNAVKATVLLLDIDRFKLINDSIGTAYGDELLRQLSLRLQAAVASWGTLARVGSDEFAVLAQTLSGPEALTAAEKLASAFKEHVAVGKRQIAVSASIGVAETAGEDSLDYEQLWQHAESALLQSKQQGVGGIQEYTVDLDQAAKERLELENDLRLALERGEFALYYQPQWDIEQGGLIGAEALLRWRHPSRGMVPPVQFIPIAEDSGLINPIGEWVLSEACRQNKAWQEAGYVPIRIAVNLSIRQFEQPDLVEKVRHTIKAAQLEPGYVELEITESMAMDAERSIATLSSLKQLGVHISMDDFGTGYSSLSVLKRFPIDKLKIDRSFVRDFDANRNNALITSTIIAMAHSLNLSVIAEGVETLEQIEFLRSQACHQVQGYYYSPPLPAGDFTEKFLLNAVVR